MISEPEFRAEIEQCDRMTAGAGHFMLTPQCFAIND